MLHFNFIFLFLFSKEEIILLLSECSQASFLSKQIKYLLFFLLVSEYFQWIA